MDTTTPPIYPKPKYRPGQIVYFPQLHSRPYFIVQAAITCSICYENNILSYYILDDYTRNSVKEDKLYLTWEEAVEAANNAKIT